MDIVLILLALLGHALVWVALVNRLHSTAMSQRLCNSLTLVAFACLILIPVGFGLWFAAGGLAAVERGGWSQVPVAALSYLGVCWMVGPVALAWWFRRRVLRRPPALLRHHRTRRVDLLQSPAAGNSPDDEHHFLVHLPGNEILQLEVTERALDVPRLPQTLDRLTIVHFSDLHFTGRVGKAYFREVVRASNRLEPDLVAITGDLIDNPECIDWIPDTLGELTSRHGVYFVLGNHDFRVDTDRLRRTLADAGLVGLGGRWMEVRIRDEPILLAGNELPWNPTAADLQHAPPPSAEGGPLRIALSHSPDQLPWAQANQFDLLLAGHLHGGQIRFPIIGPIFSPSRWGVKHASGLFHAPPTVMHVTRGVSGKLPIRFNCPPEMAKLVLRAPAGS